MEVILKEQIHKLGNLGDKVQVKSGYARNFLIPQGRALQATASNLEVFEQQRAELEKRAAAIVAAAEKQAAKLLELVIEIAVQAGEGGKLFGSIGTKDIAERIIAKDIEIGKHQVRLPHGVIREVGEYDVNIHLHSDIDVDIKVVVVAE